MSIFQRGPWCDRCGQKQATSWLDRPCATCGPEIELEVERSLDALERGEVTPKSIQHHAVCLECGWSMAADDEDEADALLEVHRIVKLNDQTQEDAT